jgi:integrase
VDGARGEDRRAVPTLTDAVARRLSRSATRWDASVPGFGIEARRGGVRTWIVEYCAGGRVRRVTLGQYPNLSAAVARERARAVLGAVVLGASGATFGRVAREYLDRHARSRKRSWREDERILEAYVLPRWRARRAADVTPWDVRALLDTIVDRGAPIQANRTFALVRRVFNWAAAPDRALVPQGYNPCRGLERPAAERQRERVLDAAELRALWRALDGVDVADASLVRLALLTAQRDGELRAMAWRDVDLAGGWWTIPAARAKNGRTHRVPLSVLAVALLRQMPRESPWVFPSRRGSASGHRHRPYKLLARLRRAAGIEDVRPHDLRRTAASHMTSMGIPRATVAKLLNHADRGVTAVYDRYGYDREKREAVEAWARRLEAIVRGEGRAIGFRS